MPVSVAIPKQAMNPTQTATLKSIGGVLISDEVVDLFLPVRFYWVRRARWLKLQAAGKLNPKPSDADGPQPQGVGDN